MKDSLRRRRAEKRASWESPESSLTLGNVLRLQDTSVDGVNATHVRKTLNMGVRVLQAVLFKFPSKSKTEIRRVVCSPDLLSLSSKFTWKECPTLTISLAVAGL